MARELFDGQPVIHFSQEGDRRAFLKYAGLVGIGASLVACGTTTSTSSSTPTPKAAASSAASPFGEGDLGILNFFTAPRPYLRCLPA